MSLLPPERVAEPQSALSYPEQIAAEQARRSLRSFAEQAWPVVEPATPFVPGWHIDCICAHLEAVSRGELRNLVVNIPPRHMKSLLVSVFWFAWSWASRPELRWLFNSYAATLSIRDSLKCRRIVESVWYRARWGHVFALAGDQNQKTRFENDRTGYRIAASVGGANTGEGGDVLVVDDPHNVEQGESELRREAALVWWDETMSTRLNDQRTGCKVIVMQRVHEDDLSGHVLERGGYHHLCLPAEWEPAVYVPGSAERDPAQPQPHDICTLSVDPREESGQLLWEAKNGPAEIASLKRDLDAYGTAGQLQQRPVPREGATFKDDYFRPLPANFNVAIGKLPPARTSLPRVTFVDLAWSAKDSANFTAAATGAVDDASNVFLLDVWRERVAEKDLVAELLALIDRNRPHLLGIEEGAYKQAATQDVVRRLLKALARPVAIVAVPVTTDKEFRAQLPASRGKAGLLYADRTAAWWPTFQGECLKFPRGSHDDQVDALSGLVQLAIEARLRGSAAPYKVRIG